MYIKKTLFAIAISSASFFTFAETVPDNFMAYCAKIFPIDSCPGGDCVPTNKLQTDMYLSCNNSYLELETAMSKLPVGLKSFEGDFSKAQSYLVYNYKYNSLFQMATRIPTSYQDMVKSKLLIDNNYAQFHKNNPFLKTAFDIYKPFDTPEKKQHYANVIKKQKELADPISKSQNALNFMLYNENFYQLFLTTYKKFYPTAIYNGMLKDKKLSLYECQFINITDDFIKLQKENNFTCDTK